MLLAIIAIWAIIIPLVILAVCWDGAQTREARASHRTAGKERLAVVPRCVRRVPRPRRTITRRACPERPRTRRRPASA